MKSDDIRHWEELARKGFKYVADNAKTVAEDKWTSRADEALAGKPWPGDCANLATTVLDLCGRAGVPLFDRFFLVVEADPGDGKLVGHAVGAIEDEDGLMWIVGDTFSEAPYMAQRMRHIPVDYHWQSEVEMVDGKPVFKWRKGIPWAVKT